MILKEVNTIYARQHRIMEKIACSAALIFLFLFNEITKLTD